MPTLARFAFTISDIHLWVSLDFSPQNLTPIKHPDFIVFLFIPPISLESLLVAVKAVPSAGSVRSWEVPGGRQAGWSGGRARVRAPQGNGEFICCPSCFS